MEPLDRAWDCALPLSTAEPVPAGDAEQWIEYIGEELSKAVRERRGSAHGRAGMSVQRLVPTGFVKDSGNLVAFIVLGVSRLAVGRARGGCLRTTGRLAALHRLARPLQRCTVRPEVRKPFGPLFLGERVSRSLSRPGPPHCEQALRH